MQLFKKQTSIDFLCLRKVAALLSLLLLMAAIASISIRGLNFGIDFTGGTIIEAGYGGNVELRQIRELLAENGFADAVVQHFGAASDVMIRIAPREGVSSAELSDRIFVTLQQQNGDLQLRRVEYVGPQVGEELANDGGLAMIYALIGILIYVSLRFEYRFAVGAVVALIHDVLVTLGIFSALQLDFDLTVLAAILAVIGYSLNDTIVVFDRIRENFRKMRKGTPMEVINRSLNQTLSRTLITSFTTIVVLAALFFFGGETIHGFAAALLIGVCIGTYSSIYIASATALAMGISKKDLMPVEKEGEEHDNLL